MANVGVEKNSGERAHRVQLTRSRQREERNGNGNGNGREQWDPLRSMRELIRWERGESFLAPLWERVSSSFSPAFDMRETKDAFEYRADVPGVDAKDLEVRVTHNRLTVTGKRDAEKREEGATYFRDERTHGSFTRRFRVPAGADADGVQARLKDGVLRIVIPKRPEGKPRAVPIKST